MLYRKVQSWPIKMSNLAINLRNTQTKWTQKKKKIMAQWRP